MKRVAPVLTFAASAALCAPILFVVLALLTSEASANLGSVFWSLVQGYCLFSLPGVLLLLLLPRSSALALLAGCAAGVMQFVVFLALAPAGDPVKDGALLPALFGAPVLSALAACMLTRSPAPMPAASLGS